MRCGKLQICAECRLDKMSLFQGVRKAVKMMRKILFPLKCIAAVLLSPLLLAAVGALLVMRYEDQMLD